MNPTRRRFALAALVLAFWASAAVAADEAALRGFAEAVGLKDVDGFIAAVESLDRGGKLPDRFVTKSEAAKRGWRPGADLCAAAPEKSIGGDRYVNADRKLPPKQGRIYREADLDFACGERGARRLVFSNDGLRFVTTDHYRSFQPVPP